MNYGRFFRLNQSLSKAENGVAIYDYIDLPAYFGPSENNPMSPKYPISVTVSSDAVYFRLHYSAYKLEKCENIKNRLIRSKKYRISSKERDVILKNDLPHYAYDKNDIDNKSLPKVDNIGLTDVTMAHMEEIILELPYSDNPTKKLSDILKKVYFTQFPQVIDEASTGGRYLEKLINKRYPKAVNWKSIDDLKKSEGLESLLYGTLREASDDSPSYSTLWLMDLIKEVNREKNKNRIDLYDKKGKGVVAFLRKLLLDFMFDLKHSDVFQNSACYQQMYSGLMSNFFFSALMHKCEYYYYRQLISEKVKDNEYDRDAVVTLYAEELSRAEDLWIKDIMSPQSEEDFYYKNGKKESDRVIWPTWFADPEEEMRRVCFTIKNGNDRKICNMDALLKLLRIDKHDEKEKIDPFLKENLIRQNVNNKKLISQWFLSRYDFKDVFHLHLFKYANILIYFFLIVVLSVFFVGSLLYDGTPDKIDGLLDLIVYVVSDIGSFLGYIIMSITVLSALLYICSWVSFNYIKRPNKLVEQRREISMKRVKGMFFLMLLLFILYLGDDIPPLEMCCYLTLYMEFVIMSSSLDSFFHICHNWNNLKNKAERDLQHIMSNVHLLLPRLVASITAAWLTMTIGFDLFVAFFDESPHVYLTIAIIVILLLFVMFEVNKVTPYGNAWNKLSRSFELILISYTISLIIGVIVINFLGPRYLERGGFVADDNFIPQYVEAKEWSGLRYKGYKKNNDKNLEKVDSADNNRNDSIILSQTVNVIDSPKTIHDSIRLLLANVDSIMKIVTRTDTAKKDSINYFRKQVAKLDSVYHTTDSGTVYKNYALTEEIKLTAGIQLFVMRDFLIMFSFIAMFMGIFIQLIIFGDNKQMTEL